ncbi:MAG: YceI family protein [Pedobacter sp.]|nr:MAG: YceI family protein [Pedobacter sp.]
MKKFSAIILTGAALIFASCNSNSTTKASEEQAVAEKQGAMYSVDSTASTVTWRATHKGGLAPRWGTIVVSSGEVSETDGHVNAGDFVLDMNTLIVDPASVTEKDKKSMDLQNHLKSPDFFDVAKYPRAEFKLTSVGDITDTPANAVEGANKMVSGNLTLLDKTMNVTFPAKVVMDGNSMHVTAKFTVNRTDWGLKYGAEGANPADWMISQDIEVGVNLKADKK